MRPLFLPLLLLVAARASAQEATPGECALALSTPIALPRVIAPISPPEMTRELSQQIRARGLNGETFALVEARVEPVLENVAAFLQTRANYPTIFDQNETAELVTRVYDELYQRLNTLGQKPADPASSRTFWKALFVRPAPAPDDQTVNQIRYLHFTLLRLADDLKSSTATVGGTLTLTTQLMTATAATRQVLSALAGEFDRPDADVLTLRRLQTLTEDVAIQYRVLENLHATLSQRTNLDQLTQDRIRRLVKAFLPLQASLGAINLDLSPIEPPAKPPEAPAVEASAGRLRISVKEALEMAALGNTYSAQDEVLENYFINNLNQLTLAEVFRLGNASNWNSCHDRMLLRFAKTQKHRIAPKEQMTIAQKMKDDDNRAIILRSMGL